MAADLIARYSYVRVQQRDRVYACFFFRSVLRGNEKCMDDSIFRAIVLHLHGMGVPMLAR